MNRRARYAPVNGHEFVLGVLPLSRSDEIWLDAIPEDFAGQHRPAMLAGLIQLPDFC